MKFVWGGPPIFLAHRQNVLLIRTSKPVRRLTTKGVITRNVSVELLTNCGTSRVGEGEVWGEEALKTWRQNDLTDTD